MVKWITLDPNVINREQKKFIRGVEVKLYASPQDVPEAVRGGYDPVRRKFVIKFRYAAGEEPLNTSKYDDNITLFLGKKSRRLHEVEIDVDRMKAEQVGLSVEFKQALPKAIEWLSKQDEGASREGNYTVAKEVISHRADELLQGAGA